VQEGQLTVPKVLLPPQAEDKVGKKTLVLDLDETLIHSSFTPIPNPDLVVSVLIDKKDVLVYVQKRPGVNEFLEQAAELYELVTFTASMKSYADPLLDQLDPHHCISHRLFREHCVYYNGEYVKDLSRLGREMSNIVILDVSFHIELAYRVSLSPCEWHANKKLYKR
jgi:RNA polymerase II subunit A small phosphatase-like protein